VAPLLFGEPMTVRRALGVLLALAGLALLATDRG
jgi:drug/metabolite transporter (DMT)-like permease